MCTSEPTSEPMIEQMNEQINMTRRAHASKLGSGRFRPTLPWHGPIPAPHPTVNLPETKVSLKQLNDTWLLLVWLPSKGNRRAPVPRPGRQGVGQAVCSLRAAAVPAQSPLGQGGTGLRALPDSLLLGKLSQDCAAGPGDRTWPPAPPLTPA